MSTLHTPGPWRVDDGPTTETWQVWGTDEPTWIADVWTTEDDARLLAAAPDLLEALIALKEVVDVIASEECEEGTRVEWWNRRTGTGWQAAAGAAAAIAKADGRTA